MTLISTSVCQSNHSNAKRDDIYEILLPFQVTLLVACLQPDFTNGLNSEKNYFKYNISGYCKPLNFYNILLAHFEKETQLSILCNTPPPPSLP